MAIGEARADWTGTATQSIHRAAWRPGPGAPNWSPWVPHLAGGRWPAL